VGVLVAQTPTSLLVALADLVKLGHEKRSRAGDADGEETIVERLQRPNLGKRVVDDRRLQPGGPAH